VRTSACQIDIDLALDESIPHVSCPDGQQRSRRQDAFNLTAPEADGLATGGTALGLASLRLPQHCRYGSSITSLPEALNITKSENLFNNPDQTTGLRVDYHSNMVEPTTDAGAFTNLRLIATRVSQSFGKSTEPSTERERLYEPLNWSSTYHMNLYSL
jgi:hypothetical protein